MKRTFFSAMMTISLLVAGFSAAPAHAALLGTFTHDYGVGQADPGGTDVLYDDYVLVSTAPADADRFSDSFDLTRLNHTSIDRFELVLTVSNTDGFLGSESWRLRPGGSTTAYHGWDMFLGQIDDTAATLTFLIDSGVDTFASMVANGNFFYWFADQGWALWDNDFKLYDATLNVYGTPAATPIPGAAWLLGSGLVGLVGLRKRMRG